MTAYAMLAILFGLTHADILSQALTNLEDRQTHKSIPQPTNYDSYTYIDPDIQKRVLNANSTEDMMRNSGVYGKCASNATMPMHGGLVCDPPNMLPQICTLVCKQGYYSSGIHKDVACADSVCNGPTCVPTQYSVISNEIQYGSRECSYTRWIGCDTTESGLCLETVSEPCNYSYYVPVETSSCKLTAIDLPNDCWTSGCMGSCDRPGVYHYYSTRCPTHCAPWQDPPAPQFACSPCRIPTMPDNVTILSSNTLTQNDPPSQIVAGCTDGYWGTNVTAYCMLSDGSFYPPIIVACSPCSEPPIIEYETFEAIRMPGTVEFRCVDGYVGDSTFTRCDKYTGSWNRPSAPNCVLDVSPSPSVSPSASNTPGFTVSSTRSPSMSETSSVSKSPRAPKVRGSRAPSPAAKYI